MNLTQIEEILKTLPALDILELVKLDEDPEKLANALGDWIEDNQDEIADALVINGLVEESEDDNG